VVPSKERAVILSEPICWRCWATRPQPEGTRKSGSLEKSAAVPLRSRFPRLPPGERARRAGMRKSGSFENSVAPLVGA
jgi:hypothetical protein